MATTTQKNPTPFINLRNQKSPVASAIKHVAFGSVRTDRLTDEAEEFEADIAVTDSPDVALKMRAETERTEIILFHFGGREASVAEALGAKFPDRIRTVHGTQLVAGLFQAINRKTKEV